MAFVSYINKFLYRMYFIVFKVLAQKLLRRDSIRIFEQLYPYRRRPACRNSKVKLFLQTHYFDQENNLKRYQNDFKTFGRYVEMEF